MKASNVNHPDRLYADAGYDADRVHQFCRETWNVESVIKPAVHRSDGGLNGEYRSQMTDEYLKKKSYGKTLAGGVVHEWSEANHRRRTQFAFRAKPVCRGRPESSGLRLPALAIK